MFKFYNKFIRSKNLSCYFSSTCSAKEKWDLITAVCLERKPIISQPLTKLEEEYRDVLKDIEFEGSLKSDHEIRHETELKQLEMLKKGDDVDVHLKETAQEFADACVEELAKFKFASKITEADKKNDLKSLNRKLDKYLILVVKQKVGKENLYLLPQALRQDGETLRQTADRILKETCGKDINAMIYGNAPCGFYKYKYPPSVRNDNGCVGAKVFFYFARYLKGQTLTKTSDYKWLDRAELKQMLPQEYGKSLSEMLIQE